MLETEAGGAPADVARPRLAERAPPTAQAAWGLAGGCRGLVWWLWGCVGRRRRSAECRFINGTSDFGRVGGNAAAWRLDPLVLGRKSRNYWHVALFLARVVEVWALKRVREAR